MPGPGFRIEHVDYAAASAQLQAVRHPVFVDEQQVPAELEWDELDPLSQHVLALDAEGRPVGTGRLTPKRTIGRMAVLREWRGRGVGEALLGALVERARQSGWPDVTLAAQTHATGFYARAGFLPEGGHFDDAGIDHLLMRRSFHAPSTIGDRRALVAATLGVVAGARRQLLVYSRDLDPGVLDRPDVVEAFRGLATRRGEIRILLQEPRSAREALAPLIELGQRLPSALAFRAVEEQVDRSYPSAFLASDAGGWLFRPLGNRPEGETALDRPARARQLKGVFDPFWGRARPCTEFRALGI
ncbi:GNAT family N-acetyltransferase [Lysobacter sp. GX 14042]|uniref:GNAT family N-acetyltransferase n=1 Tax=Lysobacter sp. GX 14042 TaxID=2907155 RepID=UPI001F249871|nr:GNAT family N-acetyltransferase [Lysobacter sp. GX 14042]MCE7031255.1 GNAT family N-acetyltransferase [Lysobacter sp. GX 14042]